MASEREVQVKASPVRTLRAYMEEVLKPDARERVIARVSGEFPQESARFRERAPVASERVPVLFVNRLIEQVAEELHEPPAVVAHRLGRRAAEEASGGVLRLAMILISMPSLLRKLAPVWTQLYTHGKMTSTSEGNSAVVELTEFPLLSATNCARITGWFEWFAQKAEKNATVRHSVCRVRNGGDVCRWELRW
jgi:hypothetical protein